MTTEVGGGESVEQLTAWNVPAVRGAPALRLIAHQGRATVIVGANGVGKSALGLWLDANSRYSPTSRVIAHRRLWMQSPGPDISPAQRRANDDYYKAQNRELAARYVDVEESRRTGVVLFDLLARENHVNSEVTKALRAGLAASDALSRGGSSPIETLNKILEEAGIAVRVDVSDAQVFAARNVVHSNLYPFNQASDGEKAALLLAAEILTAPARSLLIIDEPERHLHRSISAGLVSAALAQRADCHFVVLTHDLDLADALSTGSSDAYVLVDCEWSQDRAIGWTLHSIDAEVQAFDTARRAILGGRRNILFVEGALSSQDVALYEILFPGYTISPAGGAENVSRSVAGLRGSQAFHWIHAVGIVDGDVLSTEEKTTLLGRGVRALSVSEIENLYYLSFVISDAAEQQAARFAQDGTALAALALSEGLAALKLKHVTANFAENLAMAHLRRRIMGSLPSELESVGEEVKISVASPYSAMLAKIEALLEAEDTDGLVRMLPIRDSAFRNKVSKALKFQSAADYESFVRVRLQTDETLLDLLRAEIGDLPPSA